MSVRVQTSQNVAVEYEPASIGERLLANLFDWGIYAAWLIFVFYVYQKIAPDDHLSAFFTFFFLTFPIWSYPLLMEYFFNGQTIGKMLLNIRVVRLDGSPPSLGAYLTRWIFILIDNLGVVPFIAVLTVAINGKQRLGDLAAGTTVIRIKPALRLEELTVDELPENYAVTYPEADQLSDRDVALIKNVLKKENEDLLILAADRVSSVLNDKPYNNARYFLEKVIDDYTYLVSQRNRL